MVIDPNEIQSAVTLLAARAKELRNETAVPDDRWMLDLHRDFTARFLSDNNRIWVAGSIFVAIAFSGLAIAPTDVLRSPPAGIAIGLTSVGLLVIWNLIADRHRDFQNQSLYWLDVIEAYFLQSNSAKRPAAGRPIRSFGRAQALRWMLPILLTSAWIARLCAAWTS